jgi:hypothetical protein
VLLKGWPGTLNPVHGQVFEGTMFAEPAKRRGARERSLGFGSRARAPWICWSGTCQWVSRRHRREQAEGSFRTGTNEQECCRYSQLKVMQKRMPKGYLAVFVLALLVFAGCGRGGCNVSSSSSSSWNVNGRKSSHKTITESRDGVTRRVETTADVEFANGQVTKFPPRALIEIEEKGGAEARQAELRENAGKLELWVKDKNGAGSASEEEWLQRFLREIIKK